MRAVLGVQDVAEQVWVICDKKTKEHWVSSSGKASWRRSGHAKNAWNLKNGDWEQPETKFEGQDTLELVNLVAEKIENEKYIKYFIEEIMTYLPPDIQPVAKVFLEDKPDLN